MLVYFEVHFDDAGGYWVDNIKPGNPTKLGVNPHYGFFVKHVEGSNQDDYGVVMDMDSDVYNVDGQLGPILKEFKEKYLLELREKKLKKITENVSK